MTTPRSLASRISALESSSTDDGRFALELAPGEPLEPALAKWRRSHGGKEPALILILPTRTYEPLR